MMPKCSQNSTPGFQGSLLGSALLGTVLELAVGCLIGAPGFWRFFFALFLSIGSIGVLRNGNRMKSTCFLYFVSVPHLGDKLIKLPRINHATLKAKSYNFMQIPFFSSASMHQPLKEELAAFWQKFYDSNWYVLGPEVEAFEAAYATFNQVRFCIGVANGLDALHIALKALQIGPGDEVIVPSNTYIASWLGVSQVGATPVPVEPNPRTWNIDPQRIEAAISTRTRAIMPVHLYGQACEMGPIMELAARYDLAVVEDNAQAHGASWSGKLTGSFGHINGVSFYPTKNLGALGDAGAVTTNDPALADFAKMYRNYGSKQRYYNEMPGLNSRLDAVQAGILRIKLAQLANWNAQRELLAKLYLEQLRGIEHLRLPTLGVDCTSVWHLFVVLAKRRDALQVYLQERGIGCLIHYPLPPHLQKAYVDLGFKQGQFPLAEQIAQQCLSLPLYPGMPVGHVEIIATAIREFYCS